jgi:hypothetical protein
MVEADVANPYAEKDAERQAMKDKQYEDLQRHEHVRDLGKMPVLRPDAQYAGDWKNEPDDPLADIVE